MNINIEEQICQAVDIILDKRLRELQLDKTIECSIVEELENSNKYGYIVKYQDMEFEAFAIGSSTFNKGDIVGVLIPNNDFKNKKYILAAKDATTGSYMRLFYPHGFNSFSMNDSGGSGTDSFAIGYRCKSDGDYSTAEGYSTHTYNGTEAEISTYGDGRRGAHAEGFYTSAKNASHAEGSHTESTKTGAHAEGCYTFANAIGGHTGGLATYTNYDGGTSIGRNNKTSNLFVIGNGQVNFPSGSGGSVKADAVIVDINGNVSAAGTYTAAARGDYAELFEWKDSNKNNEDRVGYFVTIEENKIRIATDKDKYILGIVSSIPIVLGNGDCGMWNNAYIKDDFGRIVYTNQNEPKINPEYNEDEDYIPRLERPEWAAVGMLGVIPVRQDGSLEINGYATINKNGIATKCEEDNKNSYRVIKIKSDNVAEIIFR